MTLSTLKRTVRGRFFTVRFVKRGDNSLRTMTCRFGVKKDLRGGKNHSKPGQAVVWACDAKAKRSFYINSVITVRANGQEYRGPMFGGAR